MATILAIISCCWFWNIEPSFPAADTSFVEEYAFGNFQRATRLFIDQQGAIFVVDRDENTISCFRHRIDQSISVGGYGWSSTTFDQPTGVASDGVNVYVSDYGNHRIQRFDRSFNYISSLSTRDTTMSAARFGYPLGVGLSGQGDLFVLDGENLRVLKFSLPTNYNLTFGNLEREDASIHQPQKMVVTSTGTVYIAEPNHILSYDAFGSFLGSIGDGNCTNLVGCCVTEESIVAASADRVWFFNAKGEFIGQYSVRNFMAETKIQEITDVAFYGGQLYLLCPDKIHVFKIVIP
ncbi:MAG TPA: NHL repeat-containing protein [Bacteroidota bacterium]|nr:NHL repeat-containing protein [Bacteroidota bacterium]